MGCGAFGSAGQNPHPTDSTARRALRGSTAYARPGPRHALLVRRVEHRRDWLRWQRPAVCWRGRALPAAAPPLVVDGDGGKLYWNDGAQIWQAGLDGTAARAIYKLAQRAAKEAISTSQQMLYWVATRARSRAHRRRRYPAVGSNPP